MVRHQYTGGAWRHMRTPPRSRSGSHRLVTLTVAGLVVMTGVFGLFTGAASAATLSKTSWLVSNSQTGKTAVTYAFEFTTTTSGTLSFVTMTVPAGTGGAPLVGTDYGLGAGAVALAANVITYSITTPVVVSAGIPVFLSFTGMTNTTTAGTYTTTITTKTGLTPGVALDNVTTTGIVFGPSSTSVNVTVGQTLTFTNNLPTFSLVVDPSMLNNVESQVAVLTVQTNATNGYVLQASDTGLSRTGPAYTIPAVSTGPGVGVATFPATGWGASATLVTTGTATLASGFTGGDFVGYPSAAATFVTSSGPTGASADTLTLTDQVGVNYTVPEGSYSDTITYVATPSY